MNTRKIRNTKGITLVALIVTIIVLLILAGISLNLIMGEKGITQRAVNAGKVHNISGAKEKLELQIADYAGEYYQAKYVNRSVDASDVGSYVLGKFSPEETTFEENYYLKKENSKLILTSSDRTTTATCTVDSNGKVEWEGTEIDENPPKTLANTSPAEYYGDQIDYDVDLGNDPDGNPINIVGSSDYDWEIFLNDGTNIYIIAEDYVPLYYPTTRTINSMMPMGINNNTTEYSTKPYSLYWNWNRGRPNIGKTGAVDIFGSGAPIMTQYIANKYLSVWKSQTQDSIQLNARMTAVLMDTRLWADFANSTKVNNLTTKASELVAIGGPTVEMWLNSWNKKHGTESSDINKAQLFLEAEMLGYSEGKIGSSAKTFVYLGDSSGYGDLLFFPRTISYKDASGYWLTSPSSARHNYLAYVNCGVIGAGTNWSIYYRDLSETGVAVRPVVCLPSDITAEWDDSEQVWRMVKK